MSAQDPSRIRAFEATELDPVAFSHADHVEMACEMLRAYGFADACAKYSSAIQALARKANAPKKFNATITFAFMSLIAERMATVPHEDYQDFIAKNMDLRSKTVLEKWYSPERLNSEMARQVFVLPDMGQGAA